MKNRDDLWAIANFVHFTATETASKLREEVIP
jgi:hypothetical protein